MDGAGEDEPGHGIEEDEIQAQNLASRSKQAGRQSDEQRMCAKRTRIRSANRRRVDLDLDFIVRRLRRWDVTNGERIR